jgi:FixJ family two-component response regulator
LWVLLKLLNSGPHAFFIGPVDDDPRVLESFEELLASSGYNVSPFLSAEALFAEGGLLRVDCLISDIGMPGMSGWELLHRVHEERPDLPSF